MNRKMKVFGLVAVAALAMSVVFASAASANFTSENYPAEAHATSSEDEFHAFGSSVQCTNNTFTGSLAGPSDELTITPKYDNCTFFGFPATVDFTSCDYLFTTTTASDTPEVHVKCANPGDTIDITIFASHAAHTAGTPICHIYVPEQGPLHGHQYTNNPDGTVTLSGNVSGITAIEHRTSFVCPGGTTTEVHTTEAEYTIQPNGVVVSGDSGDISVHE